jgi:hypothetical protein
MTGPCTPPPDTKARTWHWLEELQDSGDYLLLASLWGDGAWVTPWLASSRNLPDSLGELGYRYVGPIFLPNEVERLRLALKQIADATPAWYYPWTHDAAENSYWELLYHCRCIARTALETKSWATFASCRPAPRPGKCSQWRGAGRSSIGGGSGK